VPGLSWAPGFAQRLPPSFNSINSLKVFIFYLCLSQHKS
jgi:hypothetical protein